MFWAILALLTSFLWAISVIIGKYTLVKWNFAPLFFVLISGFLFLLQSILILFIFHPALQMSLANFLLIILGEILYLLFLYVYFKTLKIEEASRLAPTLSLNIIFTILLSVIFLKEIFTLGKYVGMIFVIIGIFLVSVEKHFKIRSKKILIYVLLFNFLSAASAIVAKLILFSVSYWTYLFYSSLLSFLMLFPIYILYFKPFSAMVKKIKIKIMLPVSAELLSGIGGIIWVIGISVNPLSLFVVLCSLTPFFVLLLVIILTKFYPSLIREDIDKKTIFMKFLAVIFAIVGTALLI